MLFLMVTFQYCSWSKLFWIINVYMMFLCAY